MKTWIIRGLLVSCLLCPGSEITAMELRISKETSLSDLFSQDIYPMRRMTNGVGFSPDELVLRFGGIDGEFKLASCRVHLSFFETELVSSGEYFVAATGSFDSDLDLVKRLADWIGAPLIKRQEDTVIREKMTARRRLEDGSRITVSGERTSYGETPTNTDWIQIIIYHDTGPHEMAVYREDDERWAKRNPPYITSPAPWSHLPLARRDVDRTESFEFLFRVSSYDDDGKLLPKFAEEYTRRTAREVPTTAPTAESNTEPPPVPEVESRRPVPIPLIATVIGILLLGAFLALRAFRRRKIAQ